MQKRDNVEDPDSGFYRNQGTRENAFVASKGRVACIWCVAGILLVLVFFGIFGVQHILNTELPSENQHPQENSTITSRGQELATKCDDFKVNEISPGQDKVIHSVTESSEPEVDKLTETFFSDKEQQVPSGAQNRMKSYDGDAVPMKSVKVAEAIVSNPCNSSTPNSKFKAVEISESGKRLGDEVRNVQANVKEKSIREEIGINNETTNNNMKINNLKEPTPEGQQIKAVEISKPEERLDEARNVQTNVKEMSREKTIMNIETTNNVKMNNLKEPTPEGQQMKAIEISKPEERLDEARNVQANVKEMSREETIMNIETTNNVKMNNLKEPTEGQQVKAVRDIVNRRFIGMRAM